MSLKEEVEIENKLYKGWCIYYILNKINEKIYIGSTNNYNRRIKLHIWNLRNKKHANKHLQSSWNKYGEENFKVGIIEIIDCNKCTEEELIEIEQVWIDEFNSLDAKYGYNIIEPIYIGRREFSIETREKLRQKAIGRKVSEETKQKLSEQRKGVLNNFYGKHHTDESKEKIRKAKLGKTINENQLRGLEFGRGTKAYTEETYKKLSESHRGEKCGTSKLKEIEVIEILKMIQDGYSYSEISEKYNISSTQISRIRHKERWNYLYEQYPELYDQCS